MTNSRRLTLTAFVVLAATLVPVAGLVPIGATPGEASAAEATSRHRPSQITKNGQFAWFKVSGRRSAAARRESASAVTRAYLRAGRTRVSVALPGLRRSIACRRSLRVRLPPAVRRQSGIRARLRLLIVRRRDATRAPFSASCARTSTGTAAPITDTSAPPSSQTAAPARVPVTSYAAAPPPPGAAPAPVPVTSDLAPAPPAAPQPVPPPGPAEDGMTAPVARCSAPAAYPSRLRTDPPSRASGDVSRAFVDARGCKLSGNGVNIFPIWNDPPREAFNQWDYDSIRAKGFTFVRFVMPWAWYEPLSGQWSHIALLDRAVEYARRAGLYVVLDPFHLHSTLATPAWATGTDWIEQVRNHGRSWLTMLVARYRDNPTVAGYDLVNEPDPVDQNRALRMYDEMIGWVRAVDPEKIVMVSSPWGNSSMAPRFADERLLTHRRNVVYTHHDYYAGDGNAATASNGYNASGLPAGNFTASASGGYPDPADEGDFQRNIAVHVEFARRADVPMWIGEFGIDAAAKNATEWVDDKVALYERLGLGRTWWMYKYGGDHALRLPTGGWNHLAERLGL